MIDQGERERKREFGQIGTARMGNDGQKKTANTMLQNSYPLAHFLKHNKNSNLKMPISFAIHWLKNYCVVNIHPLFNEKNFSEKTL